MNIVLIISDTFTHDNLHDGATPVRTPELRPVFQRAMSLAGLVAGGFPQRSARTDLTKQALRLAVVRVAGPVARQARTHLPEILAQPAM